MIFLSRRRLRFLPRCLRSLILSFQIMLSSLLIELYVIKTVLIIFMGFFCTSVNCLLQFILFLSVCQIRFNTPFSYWGWMKNAYKTLVIFRMLFLNAFRNCYNMLMRKKVERYSPDKNFKKETTQLSISHLHLRTLKSKKHCTSFGKSPHSTLKSNTSTLSFQSNRPVFILVYCYSYHIV